MNNCIQYYAMIFFGLVVCSCGSWARGCMPALESYRRRAEHCAQNLPRISVQDFLQQALDKKQHASVPQECYWLAQQALVESVLMLAASNQEQARMLLATAITQRYAGHQAPLVQFFVDLYQELRRVGVIDESGILGADIPDAILVRVGDGIVSVCGATAKAFLIVASSLFFGKSMEQM